MFIYKWPADKENDTGIVSQLSYCDVSGEHPTPRHATPRHPTTGRFWGLWDLQGAGGWAPPGKDCGIHKTIASCWKRRGRRGGGEGGGHSLTPRSSREAETLGSFLASLMAARWGQELLG